VFSLLLDLGGTGNISYLEPQSPLYAESRAMLSIRTRLQVGAEGQYSLELPPEIAPGQYDVVLVLQRQESSATPRPMATPAEPQFAPQPVPQDTPLSPSFGPSEGEDPFGDFATYVAGSDTPSHP
jgi:hypothetical protein